MQLPDESWLGRTARCPNCRSTFVLSNDAHAVSTDRPQLSTHFVEADAPTAQFEDTPSLAPTKSHQPSFQQVIDDRYELISQLGGGGFGVVWKARDIKLDRIVAVKLPRQELFDPDRAKQFQREAQAAARLKHPNIVSVFEVKLEGERNYIVSEYIEGLTLSDWLEGQAVSSRQAAELSLRLAETIHHAHEAGIVHRDLKPGNVLVDALGEIHITDFGLAKRDDLESSMSEDGRAMGTPAYMSPEQARGESRQADRRTDIYSLGVMIFELLTGDRPFRANKWGALQYQILTQDAPKPRSLNPDVPLDLDTICLKCLEKEPSKRYDSALNLAEELKRFLRGEPILARPISRTARFWRACKRQPLVTALSLISALVVLLGLVITTHFGIEANLRAEEAGEAKESALADRDKAKQNEDRAKEAEKKLRTETNRVRVQQARQSVAEGWRQFDYSKDFGLAADVWPEHLLWFAQAFELSPEKSEEERINRMRMAAALSNHPLEDFWPEARFAAFNADGTRVLTTSDDGDVTVYDTATHKLVALLRATNLPVVHASFSPDGKKVAAVGYHRKATVWDLESKKIIFETPEFEKNTTFCAFNPESDMIFVLSHPGRLERYGLPSHLSKTEFRPLNSKYEVLKLSPDTKWALAVLEDDKSTAVVIDSLSGVQVGAEMKHGAPVKGGAFSADSSLVATFTRFAKFPETQERTVTFPQQNQNQNNVKDQPAAKAPSGDKKGKGGDEKQGTRKELVTVEVDACSIRVWEADGAAPRTEPLKCDFIVEAIAIDPLLRTVAVGGAANDRRLTPNTDPGPQTPETPNYSRRSDSTRRRSLPKPPTPRGRLEVWAIHNGTSAQPPTRVVRPVRALTYSADGARLVSAGGDYSRVAGAIRSWTVENGRLHEEFLPWLVEFFPRRVFISNDRIIASGNEYRSMGARMWNRSRAVIRGRLENSQDAFLARFTEDGQAIEGCGRSDMLTWDANTLKVTDQKLASRVTTVVRKVTRYFLETKTRTYRVNLDSNAETRQGTYTVAVPRTEETERILIPEFAVDSEKWFREQEATFDTSSLTLATPSQARVVGVSPDQKRLVFLESQYFGGARGSRPTAIGQLRLFDATTGKPISRSMPVDGDVRMVRMDPTQRLLVVVAEVPGDPNANEVAPPAPAAADDIIPSRTVPVSFTAPLPAVPGSEHALVMVWDLETSRLVMPPQEIPDAPGGFIQFDQDSRRFVVKLSSALYLFDLTPDWLPSREELVLLSKWASFHDFDETGAINELNPQSVGDAWKKLVR